MRIGLFDCVTVYRSFPFQYQRIEIIEICLEYAEAACEWSSDGTTASLMNKPLI
jgi:hypothetical protein